MQPNELITHHYTPDVQAQVKLVYIFADLGSTTTKEGITSNTCLPRPGATNYKIMPTSIISSIIWDTTVRKGSTK